MSENDASTANPSQSTENQIIEEALKRFQESEDGEREIRETALEDLNFVFNVGDGQWDKRVRQERGNRPMIVVNKLKKFINQEIGRNRQNRFKPKVTGVDLMADPKTAEVYNGIIRNIEYQSTADVVYDTAYKYALSGGFGYFRIVTEFADDSFNQDIFLKRISNPFQVHLDPNHREFDASDGEYAFIEEVISRSKFEELYPGKPVTAPSPSHSPVGTVHEGWFMKDSVRIVEYFRKVPTTIELAQLDDGSVIELKEGVEDALRKQKIVIAKKRKVKTHKVKWLKMSGSDILEGEEEWAGKYIPIIPVYGDEVFVNGKRYLQSMIRDGKDPQRMYNYWRSLATELVALAPKAPFIVTAEQIQNHTKQWEEANRKNYAYLLYNNVPGLAKPAREPQTQVPNGVMNEAQVSQFDIDDTIGKFEASKGAPSNERSGKAIKARIEVSERGSFIFPDNMRRSMVFCSKQLIDLIPKIYDTHRVVRIRGEDNNEAIVEINKVIGIDGNQNPIIVNDLNVGKYDVQADIGLYTTEKEETLQRLTELMQFNPQAAILIAPIAVRNMDIKDGEKLAKQLEAMVPPELRGQQPGNSNTPPGGVPPAQLQ